MEIEEHVFKICQMFGLLLLFCTVWLALGAQDGLQEHRGGWKEVLAVLEEVAGSGRVKPQQRAELCQLRNKGVVCLSLAGYQVKVLWCEFICWLFPVHDVMLSVSAIFITPSSVAGTCSQSQPQRVWKQLLDLFFCIFSPDL